MGARLEASTPQREAPDIAVALTRPSPLHHTHPTSQGLEALKGLNQLKGLNVGRTKISPAGIDRLRKALPTLRIGK